MTSIKFVVDADGTDCYGKYELAEVPELLEKNADITVVPDNSPLDSIDDYTVIEWRYESTL